MSEQCTFLNVLSPPEANQLHPVMVFIHGGAFLLGSGADAIYRSHHLTQQGKVVLVTINYRLGAFGRI